MRLHLTKFFNENWGKYVKNSIRLIISFLRTIKIAFKWPKGNKLFYLTAYELICTPRYNFNYVKKN